MPHIATDIPQNIFHLAIKGEFLRIAWSTLNPVLGTLYLRLKSYSNARNDKIPSVRGATGTSLRKNNHGQKTFLAPSADKQTRSYNTKWSNHHPSISTLRPKGLSRSKMKWWAIYANLPVNVSQTTLTFLALSADKQTRSYDTKCSNHHPSISTLRPKRLSRSKM